MIFELTQDFRDAFVAMPAGHGKRPAVKLLGGAIDLSAHVLRDDALQLGSQLHGRLRDEDGSEISRVLARGRDLALRPWLRPVTVTLTPPGGPLLRTLEGHVNWVHSVVLTADGRRAVSGSRDNTLKVWDLETGQLLRTLEGRARGFSSVALSADGHRAVSGSEDKTLKVWDLDTGEIVAAFTGESPVFAVAIAPDDRTIVAGEQSGRVHFLRLMEPPVPAGAGRP